jgi:hypothetical protein
MNITTEFSSRGLIYDRYANQSLELPYNLDQLKIQPNDTVTNDVVNLKLEHLYDNFLYLYKNCKISSNYLPVSASAILGFTDPSGVFSWSRALSSSQFYSVTGVSLADTKSFFVIKNNELPVYTMFCSNGTDLYVIKNDINDSTVNFSFSSNTYNPEKITNVNFENIVRITNGPNNTLLILDTATNTLYQYDASGFYVNDTVLIDRLIFLRFLGGFGSIIDKLSFNKPEDVVTYNQNIYVLDSGNLCIKKYDENLNWVKTYRLIKDFKDIETKRLKADASGTFYVLTNQNTILKYTNDFQTKEIIYLETLESSETAIDIIFSSYDSNTFYIITNQNVYKRFLTNYTQDVGKYLLYNFSYNNSQTLCCFATISFLQGDKTFLISKNGNTQTIGSFYDNANLYDILTIPDFDVYGLSSIQIKNEEYVQSWVINKCLSKIVLNHMRLRDQIIGKFLFVKDSRGNVIFDFTRYLTPSERQSILFNSDITYLTGQNEVVSNAVLNRCIEKIYNIQSNLLNILKDEQVLTPSLNATVFLG